jgi:hypothetical protein
MTRTYRFFAFLFLLASSLTALAQDDRKDKTAVTYEELYDEPYSINKLFVHFQPLYGELFATNVNAGFGLEAAYYYQDKASFRAAFRKSYSDQFFDINRDLSQKTGDVDNDVSIFKYIEFGGTYHIKDFEQSSKTKMFLYKKSYKGNKWASRVPLSAEVPCKVRKIYGARLGGIIWNSTVDVNRVMEDQDLTNDDFENEDGATLASVIPDGTEVDLFSNISSAAVYLGGSMTWIRNVAVSFDKFETGVDDLMLTAFVDLIFSPRLELEDMVYTPKDENGVPIAGATRTYSASPIDLKKFGFRAGIEGKFNRTLSWAYGGEIGYRPSVAGRGFYAMLKISFPVYSTNLDYKVESFGK